MVIARSRIAAYFAGRVARGHHADLALQIKRLFCNRGPGSDILPRLGDGMLVRRMLMPDTRLTAPIVAPTPDLQIDVPAKRLHRPMHLGLAAHHTKRTHRKS